MYAKNLYTFLKAHDPNYQAWIRKNESYNEQLIRKEIENFKYKPKISIITPVYNVDPKWLNKCINSVLNQYYDNWEFCLYDDASTNKKTINCLKRWENADPRIKIVYGETNQHISGASNEALKMATGEFVALLDNDDELPPNAFYENVKLLNEHPEADMIYSDEDKITTKGRRMGPFFKPDWSLDLFLSMMYTSHLGLYRKSIIDEIGGFRRGYEGSQDYDLVLRFIEKTTPQKIFHIPKVLYHRRMIPGSAAEPIDAKDYAHVSAKKALSDYLKRNNIEGTIEDGLFTGSYRVKRAIVGSPKVSIVIPFKDQAEVLRTCVNSILEKTDYKNYEIILVSNQSNEQETLEYLDRLKINPIFTILQYDKPFNFSAINNYATSKASGEYLLFLNNDTEVINSEWLSSMLEHAQRDEVGVVGVKLLYPNDTVQHAGVVMGLGGVAGHAFKYFPISDKGYFGQLGVVRNYSAVTAACVLTKTGLFNKVGGFNENDLKVAYNDVDLCLRILEQGYLIVYTPYAQLYHYESLTRGYDEEFKAKNPDEYKRFLAEQDFMYSNWSKYIEHDPYYSPNLTRVREDFSIRSE